MKYLYKFRTGTEEYDLDEEWVDVLRDLDRLESNAERRAQYHNIHYDAIGFEPDFMGKEDPDISAMMDGSPAFEYAISCLKPRHQTILYRRAVLGEKIVDIAASLGVRANTAGIYYKSICAKFIKCYSDGVWLYSSENANRIEPGKAPKIPRSLDPAQIMAIRACRMEFRSIEDIAKILNVPISRVKACLRLFPVLETRCPNCNAVIKQTGYGVMQIHCSKKCYEQWHRKNSLSKEPALPPSHIHTNLERRQKLSLDYYRQLFLSQEEIHRITGFSDGLIAATVYTYPLPYTICRNCGKKVYAPPEGKKVRKYCSDQCMQAYGNRQKAVRKNGVGRVPEVTIPPLEQLYLAADLRGKGFTLPIISAYTGLSYQKLKILFRFDGPYQRKCQLCGQTFETRNATHQYCSGKCKQAASNKRKSKKRLRRKGDFHD